MRSTKIVETTIKSDPIIFHLISSAVSMLNAVKERAPRDNQYFISITTVNDKLEHMLKQMEMLNQK